MFYYERTDFINWNKSDYEEVKVKYSDEKPKAERFNRKM